MKCTVVEDKSYKRFIHSSGSQTNLLKNSFRSFQKQQTSHTNVIRDDISSSNFNKTKKKKRNSVLGNLLNFCFLFKKRIQFIILKMIGTIFYYVTCSFVFFFVH